MTIVRNLSAIVGLLLAIPAPSKADQRVEDQSVIISLDGSSGESARWAGNLDSTASATPSFSNSETAIYLTAHCKRATVSGALRQCYLARAIPDGTVTPSDLRKFLRQLRLQSGQVDMLNRNDVELFVNLRIADSQQTGQDRLNCIPPFCGKGWPILPPPPVPPPPQ